MKRILSFLIVVLFVSSCGKKKVEEKVVERKREFNQELADELRKMAEVDQVAAYIPQGEYKNMTDEEWNSFKDSVFTTHGNRLKQIFEEDGFVGYDLAGKEGSQNFWLMIQHCDFDPDFQMSVLEKMKVEVEKDNAKPSNYGLLVDRVKLNTGQDQVYGTQVSYNLEICQAYAKNLADRENVNKRRKEIGLEPLEKYLNEMSVMNFEMNKEYYVKKGITAPKLYSVKY